MIRGGHVSVGVADVEQAVRFYIETLGMKLVEEHGDGSASIDAGDGFLLRIAKRSGSAAASSIPAGAPIVLHAKVPLDEAVAIFENRGVAFERTAAGARFVDPDGNAFALTAAPGR